MQSTKICSSEDCERPARARGLCAGHYQQQRKGQELRPLRSQITLEQRFWSKIRKTPDCWVWTAATDSDGYGQVKVDGRYRRAHRVAWEMTNGPIPDGMVIDHRCGNPSCVNPDHLRATTHSQNMQHRTGANKNNLSGVRGVCWHKRTNSWAVYVSLNGRTHWGGLHSTLEAADKAARVLRAELHTHDDHDKWLKNQKEAA